MADSVWFWQRIVSPHIAGLAAALAARGHEVTYVAERAMSPERASQGWQVPDLGGAALRLAPTARAVAELVAQAPAGSVHVCQGVRGNGLVAAAQAALARRALRQFAVMEAVDDDAWPGALKRWRYRHILKQRSPATEKILAIGHRTPQWLADRGYAPERIVPFAYFLAQPHAPVPAQDPAQDSPFRFVFVGRFVDTKRLDLLIEALSRLPAPHSTTPAIELVVVGSGPLEGRLEALAQAKLGCRTRWLGRLPREGVAPVVASCDCLVLPSRYDGWGAVVCEALMAGTPAICSDGCGVADVVAASGSGGVFPAGDVAALTALLGRSVANGRWSRVAREALERWAECLTAESGADYLASILGDARAPIGPPPWLSAIPPLRDVHARQPPPTSPVQVRGRS